MNNPDAAMLPVMIEDCFGWFHRPQGQAMDVAVLLAPGAGQDYGNGYRPLRVLADRLAAAGIPALRFDYPGTGDSADLPDPESWESWRRAVTRAADWLRRISGGRLVLAGLRAGAALAALEASARDDVAGLVLFEPILALRSFVLQMTTEARLRRQPPAAAMPAEAEGLSLGELRFSAADVQAMRATDLTRLAFRAAMPAAIFAQADAGRLAARLLPWSASGVTPKISGFAPFEALLRPNQHSDEPEIDAAPLLDWLRREIRPLPAQPCPLPWPAACRGKQWEEKPFRFGADPARVGMLCRPRAGGEMVVLIGNSGGNPRHGFARFGTRLCRRLAEAGIASLRFDFPGLGDSIHLEDGVDTQSDVFRQDREAEFSAAIDALLPHGFRRFAVHGLCSGAYHAVRAAASDARIEALSVVNLPWFTLRLDPPGPQSAAQKILAGFRRHGKHAQFLFSAEDAGLQQFERHFGPRGQDLRDPDIAVAVSGSFDHELTETWMQDIAIAEITRFLRNRIAQPNAHPVPERAS